MTVFISGGCKNGKSFYAQRIARELYRQNPSGGLYYLATMRPADGEDDDRILRHRAEREGWGFTTVEQPINIAGCLEKANPSGTFLLDSTTALLANEMFTPDGGFHPDVFGKISDELALLCAQTGNLVVVSDTIFSDAAQYDEWTELYRRGLAAIDCSLAKICDVVLEITFGAKTIHKGKKEAAFLDEALTHGL